MTTVNVTETAAAKALDLLARSERPEDALRVRVIDGGCSGMRYELIFDGKASDDDEESRHHGLRVLVDSKSREWLAGTTVDFVDSLNESGFKIENPSAQTTCGCGESFNV